MHTPNYIGVTGLTTDEHVQRLADVDDARYGERKHDVMAEFLTSVRTQSGEQMSKRHVQDERHLRSLLDQTMQRGVSTAVHYEMNGDENFPDHCIGLIRRLRNEMPDLLQLNGKPTPDQLRALREKLPSVALVYQLSPAEYAHAMEVYQALDTIRESITYVLLDASRGTGKECDVHSLVPVLLMLRDEMKELGIGIAGGQSGETIAATIDATRKILRSTNFSVDAESKLFDPNTNIIDPKRFGQYVIKAHRAFLPK